MKSSFLRLLRSGFLVFCFLLSSQAALVHAYTHVGQLGASASSDGSEAPAHDGWCKQCQSSGQFENALPTDPQPTLSIALPRASLQVTTALLFAAEALSPQARGPPSKH